jgi:hypothetical protein
MITLRRILALSLVASLQLSAFAGGPGTTTGELLKIPVGTRAIGMGEAFTALADDSSALYWNPAGMSLLNQKEASFMHAPIFEGVHLEHLGFVVPGDSYAWGTQLSYLGYGDIEGYDVNNNATGNIDAYSYMLNGGLSRLITDAWSIGLSGGLIHGSLAEESANTFAVNFGTLYTLPTTKWDGTYRVAMAVQNLGPGLKYVNDRDPLPRKIKFGAAAQGIKNWPLNFTADLIIPNDNDIHVSLGSEYWFKQMLALRLGYAGSDDEGRGIRVGFGLKYGGLMFDYAYAGFGDFGASNRITFATRFGNKVRQLNGEERAILKEAKASERRGAFVQAVMAYDELLDRDPGNDHILRYMIKAHHKMAKAESAEPEPTTEVASQDKIKIPSVEEAAMAELEPGVQDFAQNPAAVVVNPEVPIGADPLGLSKLPDPVTAVESAAKEQAAEQKSPALYSPDSAPSGANAPALSPSDIYGN